MLDFARNYNAYGPPKGAFDVVRQNAENITRYADPKERIVTEAYARHFNIPEACIAHGVGSTSIFYTLPDLFAHQRAISFTPSFWEYAEVNRRANRPFEAIELSESHDYAYDLTRLDDNLAKEPAVVYICNPNNPTSQIFGRAEFLQLTEKYVASDSVIDETYLLFREDFDQESFIALATERDNIHVVLSLSKFYSVPGIRSGALISDSDCIRAFRSLQVPHTTNSLTETLVPWLLEQNEFKNKTRHLHTSGRLGMFESGLAGKMRLLKPQTNFILAKSLDDAVSGDILNAHLKNVDIEVREGSNLDPKLGQWIRFCVRKPEENKMLLESIKEIYG